MRILHVNKFYYPKRGAERHYLELSDLLKAKGHDVVPFAMKHPENLKTPFRSYFVSQVNFNNPTTIIEKFRVLGRMMYSFEAKGKVRSLLKEYPSDIMHIHNIYHQISPSILGLAKKRFNMPIVQTVHDLKLMCPNYQMFTQGSVCERCHKHKYYNAVKYKCIQNSRMASVPVMLEMYLHKTLRFYERYVDQFIAPSAFMRDKMVEWGFDKKKIRVMHNFVDTKYFETSTKNGGYFLYLGALEPEKGILTLLKAMRRAKDAKIKIAGTGSLEKHVRNIVKDDGLEHRVEVLGNVERDEARELLQNCTALLQLSELYENNPLAVLEAQATGKATIGSDIGGIPELIGNEEKGLLFKAGDHIGLASAIEKLSHDAALAREMGKNAREAMEQQGPDAYVDELIEVYNTLIKTSQ